MNEHTKPRFENIMIIDDNSIDLYITSRMIIANGFGRNVLKYNVAFEALEYLKENENNPAVLPQFIFVDIYMPVMSGFEFMEAYEDLAASTKEQCSVYVISSTIDERDIVRAESNKNVTAFQVKPVTREFLEEIL